LQENSKALQYFKFKEQKMKITAAVVESVGAEFTLSEVELDGPGSGEVLVKVKAAGICRTDIGARNGNYPTGFPAVFGHEGAGVVEQVGPGVAKVAPGDHVLLSFNSCGHCPNCQRGHPPFCSNGIALNVSGKGAKGDSSYSRNGDQISGHFFGQSSFATHSIANERNIVVVPKDAPLETLAPLGCGFQTGAGAFLNSLPVKAGMHVAVLGTGSVGLSGIMAARLAGCATIIAVDISENRLALASELGATHTINGKEDDVTEQMLAISGNGLDAILDTTAVSSLLSSTIGALHSRGVMMLGGAAKPGTTVEFDVGAIHYGRTVKGMLEGDSIPDIFIPELIGHYTNGRFPIDKLITFYDFKDINKAVEETLLGKVVKAVLIMP
jgi:aryl-alcohol dehydrogenase